MKKVFFMITLSAIVLMNVNAQQKLTADTSKTQLMWLGERIASQHTGSISLKSGWLNLQDNKILSGEFEIDMASLKDSERNERLESHLKNDDFFGVEKFPVSKLMITGSTPFDNGNGVVTGTLTIKDVTKPIEFKAIMQKKDDGLWFYANFIIDRTLYNVRYGSGSFFDNLGDRTIFDEMKIKVSLLVK